MTDARDVARVQRRILEDCGKRLTAGERVLDLGCGGGSCVQGWLDGGLDAYGCDLAFKDGPDRKALESAGRLRLIDRETYRLPFADGVFDAIVSNQVMEHVQDYDATLREIRRVLKPDGATLHLFPARWTPLEVHVHIPFGGVFQAYPYIAVWTRLGVRRPGWKGGGWRAAAQDAHAYLRRSTNYLSGKEIEQAFAAHFATMRWAEPAFLAHTPNPRGRTLGRWARVAPVIFRLYRTFWARVVFAR